MAAQGRSEATAGGGKSTEGLMAMGRRRVETAVLQQPWSRA